MISNFKLKAQYIGYAPKISYKKLLAYICATIHKRK